MPRTKSEWPTHIAETNWSGLANAAREKRDARLFLIAGSIKSQLRFSSARLHDLSQRYFVSLTSLLKTSPNLNEQHAYRGTLDTALFSSVHAAFFEMATLRDYLAEYIAWVVYSKGKVDSFQGLHRHIIKAGCSTKLEKEIISIFTTNGWLREFSDRRNTLAHRMPFDRANAGAVSVYVKAHKLPMGVPIWLLHLSVPDPIPVDYKDSYSFPGTDEEMHERIFDEIEAARNREDTLAYLFLTFSRLVDFANRLTATFPYVPKMLKLTDDDIIEVKLSPAGQQDQV